ncbi:flagellar biosynthesis protein FlhF [Anoxybacter fermentans]|uniref:Flagellar biosynthesis protein FlhF n=1 Tax=Anoxybacter fermentans TaxID=1323375 RepID=A0A3S9T000_9FIRM|nr:flagellar biosynthesis protein FlhF [Anoxybacter fermentans]AZR73859.1 flagellar biosynthesis protein FlhF [Anoxybacter fermentans]
MKVKRYLGETMQDAVFKVKADLGSDAIILHTRKIREGGIFGLFGKKMFEVIATVEDDRESQVTKELRQELNILREKIQKMDRERNLNLVKKEYYNSRFSYQMPQLIFPGKLQRYAEKMVKEGVMIEIINDLCQEVMEHLEVHQLHRDEEVYQALVKGIMSRIRITAPIDTYQSRKVIAFVGPTGVGKTTTIAKLAAKVALEGKKKIGLVTADTYRIAAVEQLKTYSDIINVPLKVIYNEDELEQALRELRFCDLILIDTAGRSQKNVSQMEQLKRLLPKELVDEIHLVVAMNTCFDDLMESLDKFGQLYLSSLIFTKEDETNKRGVILNVLEKTPYKISYITFGQDVPEDIEEADPRKIAEMILKG